ncbi:MAG TPA: hypothetical protein VNG90_00975 [Candidatus Acidoferrum sp.]|nr:hypothetical protein [Candidatus Acidoferrum sp.]
MSLTNQQRDVFIAKAKQIGTSELAIGAAMMALEGVAALTDEAQETQGWFDQLTFMPRVAQVVTDTLVKDGYLSATSGVTFTRIVCAHGMVPLHDLRLLEYKEELRDGVLRLYTRFNPQPLGLD